MVVYSDAGTFIGCPCVLFFGIYCIFKMWMLLMHRRNAYIFALYFGVLSSCLYCTNWGFVLIWWFVAQFSALIGDSFVSSLIIVELFLWYERPIVFILALRGFLCLFFSYPFPSFLLFSPPTFKEKDKKKLLLSPIFFAPLPLPLQVSNTPLFPLFLSTAYTLFFSFKIHPNHDFIVMYLDSYIMK